MNNNIKEHKWIEISKDNLRHNISFLKKRLKPGSLFCSVIKANAYGHGLLDISREILDVSDIFAVHEIKEAGRLIENGLNKIPILLLGPILPIDMKYAVENDIHLTVYEENSIRALNKTSYDLSRKGKIHLKIDTGTIRQGILPEETCNYLKLIRSCENLELCGISMHFANIEDTFDHSFAFRQLQIFNDTIKKIREKGFNPKYIHSACTAAAILFPDTHFNMVRAGIGIYGLWPSRETVISYRERYGNDDDLRPVLSLKARIVQIKEVKENSPIGYGCSFVTSRRTRIGVLPIGYSDGYQRNFGNRASVLINGKYARVVGRVCMNLCMIDITDVPDAELYDTVTLIGSQGNKNISAESLANIVGSINYEIVTILNPSLKRMIV